MPLVMIKSDPRAREKPCIRCGYSLRKVTDSIHCPECGLSVWLSLNNNDALENSNPDWLRRSALALYLLAATSLVAFAVAVPQAKYNYDLAQFRQERTRALRDAEETGADPRKLSAIFTMRPPRPNVPLQRACQFITIAASVGFGLALVLLTTAEGRYPDKLVSYRIFARVLAVASLLAAFLALPSFLRDRDTVTLGSFTFSRIIALLALTCAATYLREIARRAPSRRLARLSAWLAVLPLVSLFYAFIRNSNWLPDLLPLLYHPAATALFITFAILLSREARLAEKNWSNETAATTQHSGLSTQD
jgi:hypothetical protein